MNAQEKAIHQTRGKFFFLHDPTIINLKLSQHGCNQEAVNYEILSVSI